MGNSKWKKKRILTLLAMLIFPVISGCWDRAEIEERALVLGIGIDTAGKGAEEKEDEITHFKGTVNAPDTGMIRVTVQVAVPGRIPLGPGTGGGGSGGAGGQNTVWVVHGVGHTIEDALNNLQQRVSPPLFFGHLRIIVVSEKVAKKGTQNIDDYFRRNPEVRRMNWMFVCQGSAEKIMLASPQLERVPTLYLLNMMDQSVKMGRFPNDFLGLFWSASAAKGSEGYLPYIKLKPEDTVEISGLAYFKNDKMVGATKPLEIPIFMGITGMKTAGGQVFVRIPHSSDYIVYGGRNRKSSIKSEIRNGKPHFKVKIMLEGNILEKSNEEVKLTSSLIQDINRQLKQKGTGDYTALIKKTQARQSDIFGFGEYLRAKHPGYWNREVKTKENWQRMYKDATFEITVQSNIRRVGMKAK